MATGDSKNIPDTLPPWAWEKIENAIQAIGYGSITLIVQDGRVIQIELNEKIRVVNGTGKRTNVAGVVKSAAVGDEIAQTLAGLQFGQAVVQVKDGNVMQIDRTEKKRMPRLEGMGGEGI